MTIAFDRLLLSRIEDAGLNASAPPEQRWLDGWLVRFNPGKAKRSRCVNAVALGLMSCEAKLRLCEAVYAEVGLELQIRITPFSQPPTLDVFLERLGFHRQDETRVMVRHPLDDLPVARGTASCRLERLDHRAFSATVGRFRGTPSVQEEAHARRLAASPVPFVGFAVLSPQGVPVACGQYAKEADLVGLFDVFTSEPARGKGVAYDLCRHMLELAGSAGARTAYLQVDASNRTARGVYQRLGFQDGYSYHYRRQPNAGASLVPG